MPVLTTFNNPLPMIRSFGIILGLSLPSTSFASRRSDMFSIRGTEKPQISASSTPTVRPWLARAAARFTVTELLPTPPLPLAIAKMRVFIGTWVAVAFSLAFHRARVITADRSSASISPHSIFTFVTPGCVVTRDSTSFLICTRNGQPLIVSLTPIVTRPSSVTVTPVAMPRSTMLSPSSGSITARSKLVTSAGVGGCTRRPVIHIKLPDTIEYWDRR